MIQKAIRAKIRSMRAEVNNPDLLENKNFRNMFTIEVTNQVHRDLLKFNAICQNLQTNWTSRQKDWNMGTVASGHYVGDVRNIKNNRYCGFEVFVKNEISENYLILN